MNKVTRASVALALLALTLPVAAQEQEMRPYVSGGYSYIFEDNSRASDNGDGYFISAGKALNQYWGLEFGGFYDQFDGPAANWREYGGKLDGLFFYSRDRAFSPYVGLGVGGMKTDLKPGPVNGRASSTDPFGDIGVGFFKYFDVGSGDVGMRADLRYRWLDTDIPGVGTFEEPVVKVGLVMALGPKPTKAGAVLCPDADADGVCDDADLCPNTAKGVKVDAKGCPVDSDGDGIADDMDRCPATGSGLKVDKNGCAIEGQEGRFVTGTGPNRRFEDVHFEFDKSDLTDYAKAILDNAATVVNGLVTKYPSLKVDVSGHTDYIGTDAYNQALSERRANQVKQYLLRKGVEGGRISTYAYGESKPVATNETDEGRALNRRAEIRTRGE